MSQTRRQPGRAKRPFARHRLWIAPTLAIASAATLWAQEESPVDYARDVLSRWVETRRLISEESHRWVLGKEMLEERVELMGRSIEEVRERVSAMRSTIEDSDRTYAESVAENERLKDAASALADTVAGLETRTKQLIDRIPEPIRDRVKPLRQRIPEDPAQTELALSARFMNVVGILNAIDKFHQEITITSEVRTLPDGRQAEVSTIYLGISQAFYVTQGADAAGIGTATEAGWEWQPADDAAADILRAVRILQNDEAASFVRLPVIID